LFNDIDNTPTLNNRVIDQDKAGTIPTVTSSLLQKPVTLAADNLGSCDKNPGKVDTILILDTGAVVRNEGGNKESWFDPRGDEAKSGRGVDKGDSRPTEGKKSKSLKSSARQGEFISDKIRHHPYPISGM
jgi:hypothetical protein